MPGGNGSTGLHRRSWRTRDLATRDPLRTVHYVGFRDDRYWSAYRLFGGPRMIHRRWDRYAAAEVGPGDVVVFAEGDATQPVARRAGADIDERFL